MKRTFHYSLRTAHTDTSKKAHLWSIYIAWFTSGCFDVPGQYCLNLLPERSCLEQSNYRSMTWNKYSLLYYVSGSCHGVLSMNKHLVTDPLLRSQASYPHSSGSPTKNVPAPLDFILFTQTDTKSLKAKLFTIMNIQNKQWLSDFKVCLLLVYQWSFAANNTSFPWEKLKIKGFMNFMSLNLWKYTFIKWSLACWMTHLNRGANINEQRACHLDPALCHLLYIHSNREGALEFSVLRLWTVFKSFFSVFASRTFGFPF